MRLGSRLTALGLALALLLVPGSSAFVWVVNGATPLPDGSVPTAESTPDEFAVFDDAITDYTEERGITSASLAIAVDGEPVYEQGYGWDALNPEDPGPTVSPDALFRIASITKPHTMVLVRHLVDEGKLSFDDRVFCLQDSPTNCHLDIEPYDGELGDERLVDVTVRDVFYHQGGWDRYESGHVMFGSEQIAEAMGVPSPPTTRQIAAYQLSQPLDFAPGTDRAYSNFGFAMLGLIVEKVTEDDDVDQVKHIAYDVPLDEVGTAEEDGVDVEAARTLTPDRNDREPTYHCPGLSDHVFDPLRKQDAPACWPDGGWAIEPMVGAGNLLASAPAIVDFGNDYWVWGEERDGSCGDCWGYFFGSLDGTLTLLMQRADGLTFSILTNKRWDATHGTHWDVYDVVNEAADEYMGENHGADAASSRPSAEAQPGHASGPVPVGHAVDVGVKHDADAASSIAGPIVLGG
jgi:N-acyl-D-amino-acid deacylase